MPPSTGAALSAGGFSLGRGALRGCGGGTDWGGGRRRTGGGQTQTHTYSYNAPPQHSSGHDSQHAVASSPDTGRHTTAGNRAPQRSVAATDAYRWLHRHPRSSQCTVHCPETLLKQTIVTSDLHIIVASLHRDQLLYCQRFIAA